MMLQITAISFFCYFIVFAEEETQFSGVRNVRIHIPINGSRIIDFGFKVHNALAFFPKSDKFNEQSMVFIRNGRLTQQAIKFYDGRVNYSRGKMRIRDFRERDTAVLLVEGPNGAPQKYSIEVEKD